MTPAEAAQACGVSERTIRGRIERGSLQVTKRNGRVYVRTADLIAAGLIPESSRREGAGSVSRGQLPGKPEAVSSDLTALLGKTIGELREVEREAGRLRGLLESADARERQERQALESAQAEVVQLRARVSELEAQKDSEPETEAEQNGAGRSVSTGGASSPWWERIWRAR